MIFGYKEYKLGTENLDRLIRHLNLEAITYSGLRRRGEAAFIRVASESVRPFERLCDRLGVERKSVRLSLAARMIRTVISRKGFAAGLVLCIALGLWLSNRVARIEILCDDVKIKRGVLNVLRSEGIEAGSFIPSIDLVVTERALKQRVEGISWAGITRKGNTLYIDVVEKEGTEELVYDSHPANLVACENGVIENIEIQNGQVRIPVGSGVSKGDIVVSGEIVKTTSKWIDGKEQIDTRISYARARGSITGTFERELTFAQPLDFETKAYTGEEQTKRFIRFFDAELPLFFTDPEGLYETQESEQDICLFGLSLPLGVKSVEVSPYTLTQKQLTKEQALELARQKEKLYEENFLGDYEIKDVQLKEKFTGGKAVIKAHYTLRGEMCRQVSFFMPKDAFKVRK